jgi:uncharacterized membrane protein
LTVAFYGALVWWRADDRPFVPGLIIVGSAALVVALVLLWFRSWSKRPS